MTDHDAPTVRLRLSGIMHHTGVVQLRLSNAGCRSARVTEESGGELVLEVWGRREIIDLVVARWDGEGMIEVV